ncbi:SDR family NAD(P)-dependent oxidoreductase [Pseudodesulfovibrio sp.]|nr:SDR family NAD(P)-dependent oxidoreductase [Pseudodesulfovibrio sp.]
MNEDFDQKTYLITGASHGVGQAICAILTGRGDHVVSLSRTAPALRDGSCDHRWTECDLADAGCMAHVVTELDEEALPVMDGVFLNAARAVYGKVADLPTDELEAIFRVNLFSQVEMLSKLRHRLSPGARVVYISTSASRIPAPQMGAYAASKLALEGVLQSMCMEEGWNLSILRPAEIDTEFARKSGVPDTFDAGFSKLDPGVVARKAVACLDSGKVFANVGLRAKIIDAVVRIYPQWLMKRRPKTALKTR